MVNRLSTEERDRIVGCLVEGMSIRATGRVTGAAKNTIVKLLADLGAECAHYRDATLRNLPCKRIERDEIWSYCYAKQKNVPEEHVGESGYGDVWTWTAICADTKLVPSWLFGERTTDDGIVFMRDLAARLDNWVQLTTDGPAESTFFGDLDYAQLHKIHHQAEGKDNERRYSPAVCTGIDIKAMAGDPDPELISTSYVERQNLTMRWGCAASPASPTGSARRSRTSRTPCHCTKCTTTSSARTRHSPRLTTATPPPPPWQWAWPTTCTLTEIAALLG